MKQQLLIILGLFTIVFNVIIGQVETNTAYPYDPASEKHKDIPTGEILEFNFSKSKIYPGTERTYWVYVPAEYKPESPACLYICMDGIQHNAPTVFDNLIATGEMPITIGVFVAPGYVADNRKNILRYNRSNEFDKMDDTFVRFLLKELLPEVEKQKTKDGRAIKLSEDANDRAIAGTSSGAICAFTAAWHRPDKFSRVFSSIGTYVAMRGGNNYPDLIRKTEPKPLRIFLEDGSNDVWNPLFGNWFEANLRMEAALNFAGYEVEHNWGRGRHNIKHATYIFPDVMRWLWKGWPAKIKYNYSFNDMLKDILLENSDWEEINISISPSSKLFADKEGNIIFQKKNGTVVKLDSTKQFVPVIKLSSDKRLIGTNKDELFFYYSDGTITKISSQKEKVIAYGILNVKGCIVTSKEDIYLTQNINEKESKLWLINQKGNSQVINEEQFGGTNIAIYPNHKLLIRTEKNSNWIYNYVIDANGLIKNGQRFYWLHNTDNFSFAEMGEMIFDNKGNLYVASKMGIQVCDQNGRVRAILSLPSGKVSSIAFGSKKHNKLYVISGGKIYVRNMNVTGVESWMTPFTPISQGAG